METEIKGTKQVKEPEFYPCVWVGKEDLRNNDILTEKEIKELTEEDMKELATELGDYLCGDSYSEGLRHAVERLKEIKRINDLK